MEYAHNIQGMKYTGNPIYREIAIFVSKGSYLYFC